MIDETRIERALRQGPPFRTHYVQQSLPISLQVDSRVRAPRQQGASQPAWALSWALIVGTLMLAVVIGGATLIGSGVIKPPVKPPVVPDASPSPPATPVASADPNASSAWTATGSMITPLDGPTVLLADGRVLVAGGYDEIGTGLSSAELYDPRTGSWTATGDMIEGRGGSTATLLPDGKVLVAGGESVSGPAAGGRSVGLASGELYDPRTGSWTATGSMIEARVGHTATLLPDGTVLVAGGGSGHIDLASAELYDPRTGSWTVTGSMIEARGRHTATLLPDGTVLVAGGGGKDYDLASAELYDPRTGSWTATGSMIEGRGGPHTATLLPDGTVLVAGGFIPHVVRASAELYDPRTGSWTATGDMIEGRVYHTATLLPDGRVLVAGGANCDGDPCITSTAELYDPSSRSWTATGSLALPRKFHTATLLLDGTVLVTGGTNYPTSRGWHRLATAEIYRPVSGT